MSIIHSLKGVFVDIFRYFFPPTSKKKLIRLGILLILIIGFITVTRDESQTEEVSPLPPVVFVGSLQDIQHSDLATFVGTVRAVSEADIQSEVGGRITTVNVKAGDTVTAGTILATLENSAQSAGVLQAQGAYEAALANAAQSEVSLEEAQQDAISTYRSAYTTAYSALITSVDTFFTDPNSRLVPGVRINSYGNSSYLNNTRKQLNSTFETWRLNTNTLTSSSNIDAYLTQAQEDTQVLVDLVDVLLSMVTSADSDNQLDGVSVNSYSTSLSATRSSLNSSLASLASAKENINRAQIVGTQNVDVSLANAQVKQALGVLRSAQSAYEKTVFRSPISGTVNSLRVNVGDFVSPFTQIAIVANNNAYQVSVFASEVDLGRFVPGEKVQVNEKYEGTIVSVAPAIDSVTKKAEVRISVDATELTNGSTVTVRVSSLSETSSDLRSIVPITAVKFTATEGSLFVVEDNKLVSLPVEIEGISGNGVVLSSGIDQDTVFVLDARGMSVGQTVEAQRK